jgi:hypothetical protein
MEELVVRQGFAAENILVLRSRYDPPGPQVIHQVLKGSTRSSNDPSGFQRIHQVLK